MKDTNFCCKIPKHLQETNYTNLTLCACKIQAFIPPSEIFLTSIELGGPLT